MAVKFDKLIKKIEEIAPPGIQESWDNSGLQFSSGFNSASNIKTIYLALDPTPRVIEDAIKKDADFLLTHHPFFFSPVKNLIENQNKAANEIFEISAYAKKRGGFAIYSAHTSFDNAKKGMNYHLAKILKGKNIKDINDIAILKNESLIGLTFELEKSLSIEELLNFIKEKLKIDGPLPFVLPAKKHTKNPEKNLEKNKDRRIKKVGLCAGSGAYNIDKIDASKIDIYLTGDIKYHDALDAKTKLDLPLIDLTHFHSEKIFAKIIKTEFEKTFEKNKLDIIVSDFDENPIEYYS